MNKERYILFGHWNHGLDYVFYSNNLTYLKKEGYKRLKLGYTASIYDKKKNNQTDLKLKK